MIEIDGQEASSDEIMPQHSHRAAHNPELWTDHAASMRMAHAAEGIEPDAAIG
ncbi:MAG: hypothetical protein ACLQJ0_01560 [Steroidobacteraceae bacterium]